MKSLDDTPPVLIICYGNPLRGDDGLGCIAAALLKHSLSDRQARVIDCNQLTPELAEPISKARLVIFTDACQDSAPGVLECRRLRGLLHEQKLNHHVTPECLIELAATLYGHRPLAYAVTVGGESWGYRQTLSPRVAGTLPKLISGVKKLATVRRIGWDTEANHA